MHAPLAQPDERAEVLLPTHCLVKVYLVIKVVIMNKIKTNDVKRTTVFLLMASPLMEKNFVVLLVRGAWSL